MATLPNLKTKELRSVIDDDVLLSTTRGDIRLIEGRYLIGVGRGKLKAMRR